MKSLDARTIGAVSEVTNLTAREIKAAWHSKDKVEPADVKYVRSIETRLVTFQQRAFPQMRLAYKNAAGEIAISGLAVDRQMVAESAGFWSLSLEGC